MSKKQDKALRKYAENITVPEAKQLLQNLRWKEDQCVINAFDKRVWLKLCLDMNGKRIGITDCCFADNPCERHKNISKLKGGK